MTNRQSYKHTCLFLLLDAPSKTEDLLDDTTQGTDTKKGKLQGMVGYERY